MDKVEYINKFFIEKPYIPQYSTFLSALINTLSPKQACMMFALSFKQSPDIRKVVVKKIARDIENKQMSTHKVLISNLLKKISMPSFPKRDSCAFVITCLYPHLAKEEQKSILSLFLSSKYTLVRERALKILLKNWNVEYTDIVWKIWNKTPSDTCAKVILDHFPLEFLIKNYKSILPELSDWQQRKLFGKLIQVDKNLVSQFKKKDPITYAYFLTKQGKKLSSAQAWKIAQSHYRSPNIGLLLWCFGQMGLWNVLVKFQKTYLEKVAQY